MFDVRQSSNTLFVSVMDWFPVPVVVKPISEHRKVQPVITTEMLPIVVPGPRYDMNRQFLALIPAPRVSAARPVVVLLFRKVQFSKVQLVPEETPAAAVEVNTMFLAIVNEARIRAFAPAATVGRFVSPVMSPHTVLNPLHIYGAAFVAEAAMEIVPTVENAEFFQKYLLPATPSSKKVSSPALPVPSGIEPPT